MAGAGSETDSTPAPRLRPGIDLTKLGLSLDEGILAARIDGRTSVTDLGHLVGKPKREILQILERLAKAGVVQLDGVEAPKPKEASLSAPDEAGRLNYGDYIFPAAAMNEECDLEPEERKRILWFAKHLEEWTYYELLQVKRRDDAKLVKHAYYARSKEWHPDRFRRPKLGSFKRRIDDIYKKVKEAYEVLSDPERRRAYDESIVFMPDEDEITEMLEKQRRQEREKLRDDEAAERRRRKNPMLKRIDQARGLYGEALEKEKEGDFLAALRLAQTAVTFDARPEYAAAVERLKVSAGEHRIGPLIRRGLTHESMLQWEEAVHAFTEAVRFAPNNGAARLRLAYNMVMGGMDAHEANTHAHKAVLLLPEDPEAHFVLGMCYEKGGMDKAAVRAFSRALELKPNFQEVKKRLKKLKWGF